jgi:DNA/RNA-binding domain of Phe-tRNA-synthetase-like protein
MIITIDDDVRREFPDLKVLVKSVREVKVARFSLELEKFKNEVYDQVKKNQTLESLKDSPRHRAYRDFFWKVDIDPTKIRPAAEALTRRILGGSSIPQINTVVDSYNLASIVTGVALAAFDMDMLRSDLHMRFACGGEEFSGIGMRTPMFLQGKEIVISDNSRLIAVYPYRDADFSKITENTKNVLLLVCGVPGIEKEHLNEVGGIVVDYLHKFCDGVVQPS